MSTLKFIIVGHVDHGKSTLIGRLLYDTNSLPPDKIAEVKKASQELGKDTEFAYLLDYLEEERQQGITIDTTQVFFKTDKREYIIIDVPGHAEFVKNMVTGASQAEAAILIIDTNEGVEEQTKRHAYILSLLGIEQVIGVLNKMDLVDFKENRFIEIKQHVERLLGSIGIQPLVCIPICAIKGDNVARRSKAMDWYKGPTLLDSLDSLKGRESTESKPLIFPVQDVYRIGEKRIIVGRVEAGVIEKGYDIKILPNGQITKVNSIELYSQSSDKAYTGQSIGLTLRDDIFVNRGDVICLPDKEPLLSNKFFAIIFWLAKFDFTKDQLITIRCATQETRCRVEAIKKRINSSTFEIIQEEADILENLEVGEVIIATKRPIAIKSFNDIPELGRFVLVKDEIICAGGTIPYVVKDREND